MHIPDGVLAAPVWAAFDVGAMGAAAWVSRKARGVAGESRIPLLGVMGAFVFAAQMVNFPIAAGTSAHLVGGTLLATVLGPWAASAVMIAILAVQAFVFQDGGVLALGANIVNMAVAGVFAGYLPLHYFGRQRLALFAGGFVSVVVSALLALSELLVSGVRLNPAFLWISAAVFALSGVAEGFITVAAAEAIGRLRPRETGAIEPLRSPALVAILIAAAVTVCAGVLFASSLPDGLERVLQHAGTGSR